MRETARRRPDGCTPRLDAARQPVAHPHRQPRRQSNNVQQTTAPAASLTPLATSFAGLALKNPVFVASGTYGYGSEYAALHDPTRLGGIVLKALTMKPRVGNPPNRIYETPSGMLNSIGLQNVGIEDFFAKKEADCRRLMDAGTQVLANLAAQTVEEFEELVDRLEATSGVAAYELNVSCPNVKKGGQQFGTDCPMLAGLVKAVRARTKRPLIVKLAPQVTDIVLMARTAIDAGGDALSLINTFPAMAIDAERRRPRLATVTGGLSGPAIKPIALRMVFHVHQALPNVPLLAMGGIMSGIDAVEFLLAGATAVATGTANFVDPQAPVRVIDEMAAYCARHNVASVASLTGALELPQG